MVKNILHICKIYTFILWIINDQQTGYINKSINIYQKKYLDD